jgi:hypothetical protein
MLDLLGTPDDPPARSPSKVARGPLERIEEALLSEIGPRYPERD